jgi:polyisoprenoid-binding protein YceI
MRIFTASRLHSRFHALFALAALCSTLSIAPALAATWDVDPTHSTVGFKVKHLVVANVRGRFTKYTGTVVLDDADITKSKFIAKIDVASIDTENAKRDEHLRSADFFDAAKHPQLTFESLSVKKTHNGIEVVGDLTMRGVTKPVLLMLEELSHEVKDPNGNPHRAFVMKGKINRRDFGLAWSKTVEGTGAVVGDEITLELEVELMNKRP